MDGKFVSGVRKVSVRAGKVLNFTLMKALIQYFIHSEKGGAGTNIHAYKGPFWISTRVKVLPLEAKNPGVFQDSATTFHFHDKKPRFGWR